MPQREKIKDVIFKAIDQINETLPKDKRINKTEDTIILDEHQGLDSLEVTLFVVAIEQKIEEAFGQSVVLNAFLPVDGRHPLANVGILTDHIASLINHV